MALNGAGHMYHVKQFCDLDSNIELPKCMYAVKNIYDDSRIPPTGNCDIIQDCVNEMEVEKCQLGVLKKLEDLKNQISFIKKELNISSSLTAEIVKEHVPVKCQDIVIKASPEHPPYSIWVYRNMLSQSLRIQLATYCHSSLLSLPESVQSMSAVKETGYFDITLTLIWRQTSKKDSEMMVNPAQQTFIEGEVNIARYLWRSFIKDYDKDPFEAAQIDNWLEAAHASLVHGSLKDKNSLLKTMNSELAKKGYLVGNELTVVDIVLWSLIRQNQPALNVPPNVAKWLKNLDACPTFNVPIKI